MNQKCALIYKINLYTFIQFYFNIKHSGCLLCTLFDFVKQIFKYYKSSAMLLSQAISHFTYTCIVYYKPCTVRVAFRLTLLKCYTPKENHFNSLYCTKADSTIILNTFLPGHISDILLFYYKQNYLLNYILFNLFKNFFFYDVSLLINYYVLLHICTTSIYIYKLMSLVIKRGEKQ